MKKSPGKKPIEPAYVEFNDEIFKTHNKLIFDALNEALDFYRPYGLKGKPYPWQTNPMKKGLDKIKEKDAEKLLKKARDKVMEWSIFLCGFMPDKEDSLLRDDLNIDEDYLNEIREDRLARMLLQEVLSFHLA